MPLDSRIPLMAAAQTQPFTNRTALAQENVNLRNTQQTNQANAMKMNLAKIEALDQTLAAALGVYESLTSKGATPEQAAQQVQPVHLRSLQRLASTGMFKPEELQGVLQFNPQEAMRARFAIGQMMRQAQQNIPAALQIHQARRGMQPEEQTQLDWVMKNMKVTDVGGVPTVVGPPTGGGKAPSAATPGGAPAAPMAAPTPTASPLSTLPTEVNAIAAKEGAKTAAQESERLKFQLKEEMPRVEAALATYEAETADTETLVKRALEQSGVWTTGFWGAVGQYAPGSPQKTLATTLETLLSRAGIESLTTMRQESKTGAAVGNATDKDMQLMQVKMRALVNSLDQAELKRNLREFLQLRKDSAVRLRRTFNRTYGSVGPRPILSDKDLLKQYGVD